MSEFIKNTNKNIYSYDLLVKHKHPEYKNINIQKPFLKWVGGKTQIIDKLIGEFPTKINNYHEIFLGGGSVLFALLSYVKNNIIQITGDIYCYDLNEDLINTYKNIQTNHEKLYNEIQTLLNDFNSCGNGMLNRNAKNITEAKTSKENYYYWIRNEFNKLNDDDKKTSKASAMFIFLNKTCFRGIYRVGPNGFNVPYGNYTNPKIINKKDLDKTHNLIQNVIFKCCDFKISLNNIQDNDYVYIDPPYVPEKITSFVKYTELGFCINEHNNLFTLIHKLTNQNKKMMLSNSNTNLVIDNFTNAKYNVSCILCKRTINSKHPESKTKELLIKNY